jgi:hypothetical protein
MRKEATVGFVVGFFGLVGLAAACGAPVLTECRLSAVSFLPTDPGQVTPYDVSDLVGRLRACERAADGGP